MTVDRMPEGLDDEGDEGVVRVPEGVRLELVVADNTHVQPLLVLGIKR